MTATKLTILREKPSAQNCGTVSGARPGKVRQPAGSCAAHGVPALAGGMSPLKGDSINGGIAGETASDRLKPGLHALCPSVAYEVSELGSSTNCPSRSSTGGLRLTLFALAAASMNTMRRVV